jgi:uncharacterized coiled-coil protein SlyX
MGTLLDNNRIVLDRRIELLAERISQLETELDCQIAKLRQPIDSLHVDLRQLRQKRDELEGLEPAVDPASPDD